MPRFGFCPWLQTAILRCFSVVSAIGIAVDISIALDWWNVVVVLAPISLQPSPASVHIDLPEHLRDVPLAVVNADVAHKRDIGEGVELGDFMAVAVVGTKCVDAWAGVGVDDDGEGQLGICLNAG